MHQDIQLAVFDIAGTTVKEDGEITTAFYEAMHEQGYEIPRNEITALMGYKKTEAIRMMLEAYENDKGLITTGYINALHDRFVELMIGFYSTTTTLQPLPFAEEIFDWLKDKGIKIGLNTGFSKDITNVIIKRLGWLRDDKIDYVICSNEVPAGRPQPFMIRKLMETAGITDSKQVIKIGDTEVDINEGKNAGCLYSIGVTTGAYSREALMPYEPDFIIDNLKELQAILES